MYALSFKLIKILELSSFCLFPSFFHFVCSASLKKMFILLKNSIVTNGYMNIRIFYNYSNLTTMFFAQGGMYSHFYKLQEARDPSNEALCALQETKNTIEDECWGFRDESSWRIVYQQMPGSLSKFRSSSLFGSFEDSNRKIAKKCDNKAELAPMRRLWALNKPDWPWIVVGIIGALAAGSIYPLEGMLIAQIQVTSTF